MWWLLSVALAGPPADVDLENPIEWELASEQLLDGPDGCWEVVGKATWNHDVGRFGYTRGSAAFVGRLQDGVWSKLHVESLGEEYKEPRERPRRAYRDEQLFFPLMGRHRDVEVEGGGEGEMPGPGNIVAAVLSQLGSHATYAWATWDDARDAVVLERVLPLGGRPGAPEAELDVLFPGGDTVPERATVQFPEVFTAHPVPPVRVHDARAELRGRRVGDIVFPAAEAYTAEVRVMGFRFASAQTIQYRSVQPCGG